MLKEWLTAGRTTMAVAAAWSVFDVLVHVAVGLVEVPRVVGNAVAIGAAVLAYLVESRRVNTVVAALAAFLVLGFNATWLVSNELAASMVLGLAFAWVLLALLAWAASLYRNEARHQASAAAGDV